MLPASWLEPETWTALRLSAAIALAVATLATGTGTLLAWLTTRTDLPGGAFWARWLALPYALPAYLLGMAWVTLGNPAVGLLRDLLPAGGIYGFWGIVGVEASVAFAIPFLEVRGALARLDPSLEEAARMSGASPARVLRTITLPLLLPVMANGFCLTFLYALSSFGVPALLGLPARLYTLTTLIFSQLRMGGSAGLRHALDLSLLLLLLAAAVLALSAWCVRRARRGSEAIQGARSARLSRVRLGAAAWPAAAGVAAFLGVAVLLPWGALGLGALSPIAGRISPADWTLANLREVLSLPDFSASLLHSVGLALAATLATGAAGFLLGYAARRRAHATLPARTLLQALALIYATPGTILAVALIFAFASLPPELGTLAHPLIVLGVAYFLKMAALPARAFADAFRQVHPSLDEAGRVFGAGRATRMRRIWWPLLRPTAAAAAVLTALPLLSELTISVLLTGPGGETLGTLLFQLQEYADPPKAAALAWVLLSAGIGLALLATLLRKAVSSG